MGLQLIRATLFLFCALPATLSADLYIEMTTTVAEGTSRKPVVTRTWFKKDKAANQGAAGSKRMIRFDRELIWDLDISGKRYRQTSFSQMRKLQADKHKKRQAQAKKLEAMLADPTLPAEQREQLKRYKMMLDGPKYSIKVGAEEQISGYKATRFEVMVNGKPFMTVWATRALGNVEEFNRLNELSGAHQANFLDELRKIKGVWIQWQTADGQRVAKATKISTDPLDDALFEIPAGFTAFGG